MAQLTEDELREAAAEAGISPNELRQALAVRDGGDLARAPTSSVLGAPTRGVAAHFTEGRIRKPPRDALAAVRASIERHIGKSGHNQGADEADVVDDDANLTYRIRSVDDGAGGALVRIDVDPSGGKGFAALSAVSTSGVTLALLGLGWLLGSTLFVLGGLGVGALGGFVIARNLIGLRISTQRAAGVAAQALVDAEEGAAGPGMLPPAR
jgi:hypothetical protein